MLHTFSCYCHFKIIFSWSSCLYLWTLVKLARWLHGVVNTILYCICVYYICVQSWLQTHKHCTSCIWIHLNLKDIKRTILLVLHFLGNHQEGRAHSEIICRCCATIICTKRKKSSCLIPSSSFILHGHANVSSTQCVNVWSQLYMQVCLLTHPNHIKTICGRNVVIAMYNKIIIENKIACVYIFVSLPIYYRIHFTSHHYYRVLEILMYFFHHSKHPLVSIHWCIVSK